jgi:methylmalonyl-CoA mutase N-terminal domain/subunit
VGVNRFADADETVSVPAPNYSALEKAQVKSLKALRKKRESSSTERALAALREASAGSPFKSHLMPLIVDAVRARATVGEIASTLAENWGYYRPSL